MAFNYEEIIMQKENLINELIECLADHLDKEDLRRTLEHCGLDEEDISYWCD